MSQSPDERFLDVALDLGVLTPEQQTDARRALDLIAQAGLSTSAPAVLADKGYATPVEIQTVEEELARRGGALPDGASGAPPALDASALQALATAEDAAGKDARRTREAEKDAAPAETSEPDGDSALAEYAEDVAPSGTFARGRRTSAVLRRARRIALWGLPVLAGVALIWAVVSGVRSCVAEHELGVIEEARRAYEQGRPKLALRLYGRVASGMSRHAATAKTEHAALRNVLQAASGLYRKGREFSAAKNHVAAAKAFQELTSRYPRSGEWARYAKADLARCRQILFDATVAKARTAEREERWGAAARLYREAAPYDDSGDALARGKKASVKDGAFGRSLGLGRRELRAKRWLAAARHFAAALRLSPHSREAALGLGKALPNLRKPEGMALIPPGSALVGEAGKGLARRVPFSGCFMDTREVSNRQYAAFVKAKRHPPPPHWPGGRMPKSSGDLPVVCVTWRAAAAYASWRGGRLPSSLEWEVAARGHQGFVYPWGNDFRRENAVLDLGPSAVGSNPADRSPFGCTDMAGNVSEWVADTMSGAGAGAAGLRVVRGCSWAGLEPQRRSRVLPAARGASVPPERQVVVDAPGRWVLPLYYPADRSLTYMSFSLKKPTFRFFLWVPKPGRWVQRSQSVAVGEAVRFAQSVAVRGAGRRRLDLEFDTGYRVVRVTGQGKGVALTNASGAVRTLAKSPEPPFGPLPKQGAPAEERDRSEANLAHVARLPNRLAAPPSGAFLNVGFRCAKDLLSWTKTLTKP